jgi:dTDP-glucose pyrophosphorylase
MLNIVIPMAGRGTRFVKAGYSSPKPLIPVHGKPMIQVVIDNLRPRQAHRFIFICQQQHLDQYGLGQKLHAWAPGCQVIPVSRVTDGAACTVLLAREIITTADPLMIANCDQYVDVSINDYLARMETNQLDGLIMTMTADDPKWSFLQLDARGLVTEVVEKKVVSNEATVGIYNYRTGASFVAAAEAMIANDLRVNNEFYVAPAYNEMIATGSRIGIYNVGSDRKGMYGLGVPEDLDYFLSLPALVAKTVEPL